MNKPRIKEVHGVLFLNEKIRIGTGYGYASVIEDPGNKFAQLIKLLDGKHTLEEIFKQTSPTLSEEEVHEAIELLLEEGYLEDAEEVPPSILSEQELVRYRVNINFFNTLCKGYESKYAYQAKLKHAHVVLFGIGGIGSNICLALAELGIGKFTAIDFDKVELHNLNRQVLYSTSGVGRLKTEIAKQRLSDFNPDIEFTAINKKIESLDDVRELLDAYPCDIVVDAADQPTGFIDFWVNQACVERQIPFFAASVAKQWGRAYSVIPGETACYNCRVIHETSVTPQIQEEIDYIKESNFWTPNGALGPACMFHAYFISYEILRYLLNTGPLLTFNRTLEINFMTFEQEYTEYQKQECCGVCGNITKKIGG